MQPFFLLANDVLEKLVSYTSVDNPIIRMVSVYSDSHKTFFSSPTVALNVTVGIIPIIMIMITITIMIMNISFLIKY